MKKQTRVLSLLMSVALLASLAFIAAPAASAQVNYWATVNATINITGAAVDYANARPNAYSFKGFGALSCNATSALIMDYKAQHPDKYWEFMEVLFGGDRPIVNHVKIEMGNDGNNSTGANPATKRTATEQANAARDPGWQLAADAKSINPNVTTSILRWGSPTWVGGNTPAGAGTNGENMYSWYKETIFDAYLKYGFILDYINPTVNEASAQTGYVTWFKDKLVAETNFPSYMDAAARQKFNNIKIVSDDTNNDAGPPIASNMNSTAAIRNAVDAIGWHYTTATGGNATTAVNLANNYDKELWYSEGTATFGYTENHIARQGHWGGTQSPLNTADAFMSALVNNHRTLWIYQPFFTAFYEGTQYSHKSMITNNDPWSGYMHYDETTYLLGHWSKFCKSGWDQPGNLSWRVLRANGVTANGTPSGCWAGQGDEHYTNSAGANSFMTLASPDKKEFSVVAVNNHSGTKTYRIQLTNMDVAANTSLYVWESKPNSYMQLREVVEAYTNGYWYFQVGPWSTVTVTTLTPEESGMDELPNTSSQNGRDVLDTDSTGMVNGVTNDRYLYFDDFEYAGYDPIPVYNAKDGAFYNVPYLESRGNEPRYMMDCSGAWEVQNGRLAHVLGASVSQWNSNTPNTIVGDFRWTNYKASVDVEITNTTTTNYAYLNIRNQTGMGIQNSGYNIRINRAGTWNLYRGSTAITNGTFTGVSNGRYNLALQANGNTLTAWINGTQVYTGSQTTYDSGRVRLCLSGWFTGVFYDNLKVETIPGAEPYANIFYDNADFAVTTTGSWNKAGPGGGSMDIWNRTTMTGSPAGSGNTYTVPKGTIGSRNQLNSWWYGGSGSWGNYTDHWNSTNGAIAEVTFSGTGVQIFSGSGTDKAQASEYTVHVDDTQVYPGTNPTSYTVSVVNGGTTTTPFVTISGMPNAQHTVRVTLSKQSSSTRGLSIVSATVTVPGAPVATTVNFPINGTGFAIIGANSAATNRLIVYVDGVRVANNQAIITSGNHYATYTYRGLTDGPHDVSVEIIGGNVVVDALYSLGSLAVTDKIDLRAAIAAFETLTESDWSVASWAVANVAYLAAKAIEAGSDYVPHDTAANAATALWNAIVALTTDKSALAAAIADFTGRSETGYTPESWAPVLAVYNEVLPVYDDPDSVQSDIDDATELLEAAILTLVPLQFEIGNQATSVVLRKGMTYQINIDSNSPTTVVYMSSNANATVSSTGLVTAVKTSSAVITVIDVYAQRYFTVTINITS